MCNGPQIQAPLECHDRYNTHLLMELAQRSTCVQLCRLWSAICWISSCHRCLHLPMSVRGCNSQVNKSAGSLEDCLMPCVLQVTSQLMIERCPTCLLAMRDGSLLVASLKVCI